MKKITIEICVGTYCTMKGAMNILDFVEDLKVRCPQKNLEINTVKCLGDCLEGEKAPVVVVNGEKIINATSERVMAKIMEVIK